MKTRVKRPIILLFAVLAFSLPLSAFGQLCTATWNGIACVGCGPNGAPAYASYWWGCYSCNRGCQTFSPTKADDTSSAKIVATPDPLRMSRQLQASTNQLRDIGSRNPWAASVLIGFEQTGPLAEIKGGTAYMTSLPTAESVNAMLAGDNEAAKALAVSMNVRARVTYRLERGPDTAARLYLSSIIVDDDERVLFKVYPDIIVDLYEVPATSISNEVQSGVTSEKRHSASIARPLVMQSWKTAE